MTHIMVPDGVLPPWLWITGWVLAVIGIAVALRAIRNTDVTRMLPLAATMAAVMTIIMSFSFVLGYEPHLTVLSGIILGPAYGFLATFVFNILRMLLGDGAPTLLGLNTVILGSETILGYLIFRALTRHWPAPRLTGVNAGVATFVALAIATLFFLAIVFISGVDLEPFAGEKDIINSAIDENPGFGTFAELVIALGAVGWLLEAIVTGVTAQFVRTVRPSMVQAASEAR
ncbi:MAG: cobalt/nickel transport system permease protein [Chloroflexota bacterium]|jgi:cobalt/nickel transport system permease protein|nr:cobalt/nickel transport system permease protein [Chloroflexota bacterium]